jgi:hypothetical protein
MPALLLGRIRDWLFHLILFLKRGDWPYCQQRGLVVPESLAGALFSRVQHANALTGRAGYPARPAD